MSGRHVNVSSVKHVTVQLAGRVVTMIGMYICKRVICETCHCTGTWTSRDDG